MENKYYTPEIEEFHVGFEYEWRNTDGFPNDEWQTGTIKDGTQIDDIHNSSRPEPMYELRIKYPDRKDIEEMGWKHIPDNTHGGNIRYFEMFEMKGGYYVLGYHGHVEELGDNLCDKLTIFGRHQSEILFNGKIKNKSEFIKLMKQLSII